MPSALSSSIGRAITVNGNPLPGRDTSWKRTKSTRATPGASRTMSCAARSRKLESPAEPARTYTSAGRMRCIQASSELRNEKTMMAIATIRLKLTSTAAMLTVDRRAVPRSWATATCRHAGPSVGRRANTRSASVGVRNTAPSSRQAMAAYPGRAMPSSGGSSRAIPAAAKSSSASTP